MKKILPSLSAALMLGGCIIANPFGGAPLVLTGNLQADMPGIQQYAADIKAGVQKDSAEVRAMFMQYCPSVNDANSAAQSVNPNSVASTTGVTVTVAQKQVGNVQAATNLAVVVCNGGTATDVKTAFVNFAAAAKIVLGWINAAKS